MFGTFCDKMIEDPRGRFIRQYRGKKDAII